MSSNGTIAVWCLPHKNSKPTTMETHFNYWRVAENGKPSRSKSKQIKDFLEIGLLVKDISEVKAVSIYLPSSISRTHIEDCSPYLKEAEFAQGIFNEVLSVNSAAAGGPLCATLLDQNQNIFCRVHQFTSGTDGIDADELEIQNQNGGSILTITNTAVGSPHLQTTKSSPVYFRLRFYLESNQKENPFIKIIQPRDRLLHSGFDEIQYIDFRMNESRTLPTSIERRTRTDQLEGAPVSIILVAFLTAIPVNSQLSISNAPSHKMRLLENNWQKYVDTGIPEGMVVYHWKREAVDGKPISDFSAFLKLQTRKSSPSILAKYSAVAFMFALAGNYIANILNSITN